MKILVALLLVFASAGEAQNIRTLPRSTSTTGLNDSALVLSSDSAARTRAASLAQLRKGLSVKAFDSLVTTKLTLTGGTVSGSPTWSAAQTFGAITVSSCTGCAAGFPLLAPNGTANNPSYSFTNSPGLGLYRFGSDTLGLATGGVVSFRFMGGTSPRIFGGATASNGTLSIVPGTGAFSSTNIYATNAGGTPIAALQVGGGGIIMNQVSLTMLDGTAPDPSVHFSTDIDMGIYRAASETFGIATSGVKTLTVSGANFPVITGGAGSMTIQAGTGNSRTLTLQTTTSAGAVKNVAVFGADSSTALLGSLTVGGTRINAPSGTGGIPGYTFAGNNGDGFSLAAALDTVKVSSNGTVQMLIGQSGALKLPLLPAEGSTKNAMCWDGTSFQVTQNAAATCTVSSARFKKNIVPFSSVKARSIIGAIHSSEYEEREGGRKAIGIIAEQADSADRRLASRDASGKITSTNYEEITSLLLTLVNDQQRQLDSLKTILRKKP